MRGRVIGAAVATAVIGLAGGGLAAYVAQPATSTAGTATPVPGSSPSVPGYPTKTPLAVADDIDYQPLTTPTTFDRFRIGNDDQTWSYVTPQGWQAYCVLDSGEQVLTRKQLPTCDEVRFRPVGEPVVGGYSLRVKAIADHETTTNERDDRLRALEDSPDIKQLHVLRQSASTLYTDLLTPYGDTYLRRFNFFQWFTAPGSSTATLEMSVVGRAEDQDGLYGLFDTFGSQLRAIPAG